MLHPLHSLFLFLPSSLSSLISEMLSMYNFYNMHFTWIKKSGFKTFAPKLIPNFNLIFHCHFKISLYVFFFLQKIVSIFESQTERGRQKEIERGRAGEDKRWTKTQESSHKCLLIPQWLRLARSPTWVAGTQVVEPTSSLAGAVFRVWR